MCDNDIDDQNEMDDVKFCELTSQNNNDCTIPAELQLEVHSDSQLQQQHDQDVAVVSAEQQLEVHCDRQQKQQHDNDVTVVSAEQQLKIHSDRQQQQQHDMDIAVVSAEQKHKVQCDRQQQQQHDNDVAVISAEQQLEIHRDRQQQQQSVSVLANYCVEEYLRVNGNGQGATIKHPGEKHSQLLNCNNTPNRIPAGISKITQLTINLFDNNYHLYARKISCPVEGFFIRAVIMKK